MEKKLLKVLSGDQISPPPLWLMRQAGRYLAEYRAVRETTSSFLEFCYTPDKAAEVTLQPIRRFGFDGSIIFSDILVIPDKLGHGVRFEPGHGPVLDQLSLAQIRDPAGLDYLSLNGFQDRLRPVYDAIQQVRSQLPTQTTLLGFAGAPWTLAAYMIEGGGSRDFAAAKTAWFSDPKGFSRLVRLLTEAVILHLQAQIDAGADALQIFDSWAGVLPENAFHALSIAPMADIKSALKQSHPGVPLIGFPRGAGSLYPLYAQKTGIDAISLDYTVPDALARSLQDICVTQGNIDPYALVAGGLSLDQEITRVRDLAKNGAHIVNLGHGIVPQTPVDHVQHLIHKIRESGR